MKRTGKTRRQAGKDRSRGFHPGEDWLSIILAFLLILMSTLGIIGPKGIRITF